MTAEERLSPPCLATQGLNQLLELPCILLPVEHPLPNSMTFLLYQDCRVSTDPNPQLVKLRHCCTSCNMGMESFGHLCYPVPPPQGGHPEPHHAHSNPGGCAWYGHNSRIVPWDPIQSRELHLLAGIRGQSRGSALPGCLHSAGGRPRRLAPFPNDPESSAAKVLSCSTSPQGAHSWSSTGMLWQQGCSHAPCYLPSTALCICPARDAPCSTNRGIVPVGQGCQHSVCHALWSPLCPQHTLALR